MALIHEHKAERVHQPWPAAFGEHGQQAGHHARKIGVGELVKSAHGEAERALVGGQRQSTQDRQCRAQESRPGTGTVIKKSPEMQCDDNEQSRVERDQGVREMKQACAVGSSDEFRRSQQVRVQQIRMNRKGKDKNDRENDEAQAGPESPG